MCVLHHFWGMDWRYGCVVLGLLAGCGPAVDVDPAGEGGSETESSDPADSEVPDDPEPLTPCDPIVFGDSVVETELLLAVFPQPEPVDGGYPSGSFDEVTRLSIRHAESLDGLECLAGLEELDVSHGVVDLEGFPELPNLKTLNLSEGSVYGPWARIPERAPNLESLILSGRYSRWLEADPIDLSEFTGFSELSVITIDTVPLAATHLDAVADMPGLQSLTLWGGSLTDLSGLVGHPALLSLSLDGHALGVTALDNMPVLETVKLETAGIEELSLTDLPLLRELDVSQNSISDLGEIAALPALESLIVDENPVSLEPLASHPTLTSLSARETGLSDDDLMPLAGTQIRWLDLRGTAVINPVAIASMTSLDFLDLSSTDVEDGSFLEWSSLLDNCHGLLLKDTPLAEFLSEGSKDPFIENACDAGTFVEWEEGWFYSYEGACNGSCVPSPGE